MLEIRGLSKSFGGVKATDNVTLDFADGSLTAVIGPNGAGKSTFFNLITGALKPDSGQILLNGKPVRAPGADRGMVFQSYTLFPWLTVADNIAFGLREKGVAKEQRSEAVREWLERIGLTGFEHHYPKQLSGGMQQRTAIARALANEPAILLLDEPFGALDALTRSYMQEELLGIVRGSGTTALLVTHDIDEALLLADRVLVMSSRPGRIKHELHVPFGTERSLDSLLQDPEYGRIRSELRHLLRPEVVEELDG